MRTKQQTGRTMVEMIAVIVIMGIIIIGACATFLVAMKKSQVRTLEREIMARVVQLQHQSLTASGIKVGASQTMKASNLLIATQHKDATTFTLRVGDNDKPLDYDLCAQLMKSATFNPENDDACQKGLVYADFVFPAFSGMKLQAVKSSSDTEDDSGETGGPETLDCGDHAHQDGTECVCEDGYEWQEGVGCSEAEILECDHGEYNNGECVCKVGWYGFLCDSTCDGFRDEDGECHSCNEQSAVFFYQPSASNECDRCKNRKLQKEKSEYNNYCVLNEDCDGFYDRDGNCHSCDDPASSTSSEIECSKCTERTHSGTLCMVKNCDGIFYNNTCYSCDSVSPIYLGTSASECSKCSNRELSGNNNYYCALKTCDGFYDFNGNCHSCDEPGSISLGASNSSCNNCENRKVFQQVFTYNFSVFYCVSKECDGYRDGSGGCHSCDGNDAVCYSSESSECSKCVNREFKSWTEGSFRKCCVLKNCDGFYDRNGVCQSCDENGKVDVKYHEEECLKCSNRELTPNGNQHYCVLKNSCDGIYDYNGVCHSCDEEGLIGGSAEECAKCDNRYWWSYWRIGCSSVTPESCDGFVGGKIPACYSCNEQKPTIALAEQCGRCDNREMKGNNCALKCDGFYDSAAYCHSCDDAGDVFTNSEAECNKCNNREYVSGYCLEKGKCEGFYDEEAECHSCSTSEAVYVDDEQQCAKCNNRDFAFGYLCAPKCLGLYDYYEVCHTCDDVDEIYTDEEQCSRCGDLRTYNSEEEMCSLV